MKILNFILLLPVRILCTLSIIIIIPFFHSIKVTIEELKDVWG